MKHGKRSMAAMALALLMAIGCGATAFAAETSGDCEGEGVLLPPPIAKNVIGVALDTEILGREEHAGWVDDGEIVVYTAYIRNDTEDPWDGDVHFTIPIAEEGHVLATGNPDNKKLGSVDWNDVHLEPFTNVTYYITVDNTGNILPESFRVTLMAAGHDGCPHGSAGADGWCGVPGIYAKKAVKADREFLEIHNDSMKGGANNIRVYIKGDQTELAKMYTGPDGMRNVKYDKSTDTSEVSLGAISANRGIAQPGIKLDVTGLEVTVIKFDACGEHDFEMERDKSGAKWTMPAVKNHGFDIVWNEPCG